MSTNRPPMGAAAAIDRNRFCVTFGHLSFDDPFSFVLVYDRKVKDNWSRFTVKRWILSATSLPEGYAMPGTNFAIVSNEGDVYFWADNEVRKERIPGAGLYGDNPELPNATGNGQIQSISYVNGRLWAAGDHNQIYERSKAAGWERRFPTVEPTGGRYEPPQFSGVYGTPEVGIFAAGVALPNNNFLDQFRPPAGSGWDAYDAFEATVPELNKKYDIPEEQRDFTLHSDGGDWRHLGLLPRWGVKDIYIESPSRIWMVGYEGAILFGNLLDGFRDVSSPDWRGESFTLVSITKFQGRIIIASEHALYTFDGDGLRSLKPKLNLKSGDPAPFKIRAVDDIMYYFDVAHGVFQWDGVNWTNIEIPDLLLDRNFNGPWPPEK